MWQRACPMCKGLLTKFSMTETLRCWCGWDMEMIDGVLFRLGHCST
jgi:hypothetical protein